MKTYLKITGIFFIAVVLTASALTSHAQVAVNFSPVVYGQTIDGLAYAQVVNSYSTDLRAKLTIKVREVKGIQVVTIKTLAFTIHPGVNAIDRLAYNNSRFSFGNNNYGLTLSQTGKFLEGEYEYCFEVDISESKNTQLSPVYENCFIHQLQPRTPLLLINPVDGDEFCNKRPLFTWQPPMPLPREARFRFVLTETKEKQDVVEAVTYNLPIVNQGNILTNSLYYPVNAPELQQGHKYAWQVIVYAGATILARSEVWIFTYKCDEPVTIINTYSYREVKETNDGNYYVAEKAIHFSVTNPYAAGDLNYSIVSMADPSSPVKGLPKLKIGAGLNKYDLDLSENRQFKHNQEYLLTVRLANNRNLVLRFIYKNE